MSVLKPFFLCWTISYDAVLVTAAGHTIDDCRVDHNRCDVDSGDDEASLLQTHVPGGVSFGHQLPEAAAAWTSEMTALLKNADSLRTSEADSAKRGVLSPWQQLKGAELELQLLNMDIGRTSYLDQHGWGFDQSKAVPQPHARQTVDLTQRAQTAGTHKELQAPTSRGQHQNGRPSASSWRSVPVWLSPVHLEANVTEASVTEGWSEMVEIDFARGIYIIEATNAIIVSLLLVTFFCAYAWLPKVYSNTVEPARSRFQWMKDCQSLSTSNVMQIAGIDQAMLFEFTAVAMMILLLAGGPLLLVEMTYNIAEGTRLTKAFVSKQSMANVEPGYHDWFYAGAVLWVVIATQIVIFYAMARFKRIRLEWLQSIPLHQATTVLMTGVPSGYRGDNVLSHKLNLLFSAPAVKCVHFVKDIPHLERMFQQLKSHQYKLENARISFQRTGMRPLLGAGEQQDSITFYEEQTARTNDLIKVEQDRIFSFAKSNETSGSICLDSAFVTFNTLEMAGRALSATYPKEWGNVSVSEATDPYDVIFSDFSPSARSPSRRMLGIVLICLLLSVFLTIAFFNGLFSHFEVVQYVGLLRSYSEDSMFAKIWSADLSIAVLTSVHVAIPFLVLLIISSFFAAGSTLKAYHLQQNVSFFFFYCVFPLMVAMLPLFPDVAESWKEGSWFHVPASDVGRSLAEDVPVASIFYIGYVLTQNCITLSELVRFPQLLSRVFFCRTCPEGGFSGMGSRSVRTTSSFLLVLCFSVMSPFLIALGFLDMVVRRFVYGYLVTFCETSKPSYGGWFYVTQLRNVQRGLFLYVIGMTFILAYRSKDSVGPPILAGFALLPLLASYILFQIRFPVDPTPTELVEAKGAKENPQLPPSQTRYAYVQPELIAKGHELPEEEQQATWYPLLSCRCCAGKSPEDSPITTTKTA
jgi:hypothetical protein